MTYLRLIALREELPEQWQRDLAAITFAVVAEISVNAYLDLLADDHTIQPQNRRVAELHNRDEYAHSKILAEVAKVMYANMPDVQRSFFARTLSVALSAFVAQDYSMWDYSGLHRLAEDLGILEQIDFDFRPTLKASAAA